MTMLNLAIPSAICERQELPTHTNKILMLVKDKWDYLDYSYLEIVRIITEFSFARLTEKMILRYRGLTIYAMFSSIFVVCTTHYFCRQRPKCTVSNCRTAITAMSFFCS